MDSGALDSLPAQHRIPVAEAGLAASIAAYLGQADTGAMVITLFVAVLSTFAAPHMSSVRVGVAIVLCALTSAYGTPLLGAWISG